MKKHKISIALGMAALTVLAAGCQSGSQKNAKLDPKNPVTVTIWNYYNGAQLAGFEELVTKFNNSVGLEKGIIVNAISQEDIDGVANALLDSLDEKVGSQELPDMAAAYMETVYILNEKGAVVDLDPYFTKEELAEYVPSFLEEGRLTEGGALLSFPISKSTEVLIVNQTDWDVFAEAGGPKLEDIQTEEDLVEAGKTYYEWTDSLTPDVEEDGKSLYGRDSLENYIYLGTKELGHEMFTLDGGKVKVDLDYDTFYTLWKNYYIPYINGYFGTYAKFRSEDAKTGKILALTGSSSGISYFPTAVTLEDDSTHDIEVTVRKPLMFKDAKEEAYVQQGAGYCILKSKDSDKAELHQTASAEFLKWFTSEEQNISFSTSVGYSPVMTASNTKETISKAFSGDLTAMQKNVQNTLLVSAEIFNSSKSYVSKTFNGSKAVRELLGNKMKETLIADRAVVLEKIADGMSREEAVKEFSTEEYFKAWFEGLTDDVNKILEK